MRITKPRFFCITLIALLQVMPVTAADLVGEWRDFSAYTFIEREDSSWSYVYAKVGFDRSTNEKLIAFFFYPRQKHLTCRTPELVSDTIFYVDGQALQGNSICEKSLEDGSVFYQVWPRSDAGFNFVINRFKATPTDILLDWEGEAVRISGKGFSASWNSLGNAPL